jgi:hypothetical protein
MAQRTLTTPSADRSVNKNWIDCGKRLVIDSESLCDTWSKGLEHNVGVLGQSVRVAPPFITFQIENHTFLTPVPSEPWRMDAEGVTSRRLDLDNFSPKIGKDCSGKATRHSPTEVRDDKSITWSRHFALILFFKDLVG